MKKIKMPERKYLEKLQWYEFLTKASAILFITLCKKDFSILNAIDL